MRKKELTQIKELIETLYEVNYELQKNNNAHGLIEDTIEFVSSFYNYIVERLGSEHILCGMLLDYCGKLEAMKLETYKSISIGDLNLKLKSIEDNVNNLKVTKFEMLFISYKSSMKDSLQSIWEKAMEDPNCDVYIMPIPYFNFMQNGQPGEMIIEIEGYDPGLPLVDWKKYDIEERRPDVIFTNNGYDEFNYITSVHPNFYSKKLIEQTECLCYVPYFVAGSNKVDHLAKVAGVIYADKVILESEEVRDEYIDAYVNEMGGKFEVAAKKFVALGSPKMDKILNNNRYDSGIPDEWKKQIIKEDGTNKVVVLYNTGISAVLTDRKDYLKKLKNVLMDFKHRKDAILLWRPHPLLEETFTRMIPEELDEYKMIVETYRSEGYGIYDDTPDLQRAISISDAYYGDGSSVTALYSLTNKPIIYQSISTDRRTFSYFYTGVIVNNILYSSLVQFNGLCKVDLESGSLEIIQKGLDEDMFEILQHSFQVRVDDDIFLIPVRGKELLRYNMNDNAIKSYKIENNYDYNFRFSFKYGNKVYMTPFDYPAIAAFDLEMETIEYYDIPINSNQAFRSISSCIANDKLILVCENPNAIITFDCKTEEFSLYDDMIDYCSVCFDGSNIWLGNKKGDLIKWDDKNEISNIPLSTKFDLKSTSTVVSYMACVGDYLSIFPSNLDMILRLNVKTNMIDYINMPSEEKNNEDDGVRISHLSYLSHDDKYLHILNRKNNVIVKVDVKENINEIIKLNINKDINFNKPFGSYEKYKNSEFIYDTVIDMDYLISNLPYRFDEEKVISNNGEIIYDYFKDMILGDD